jgi:hypothetical protein
VTIWNPRPPSSYSFEELEAFRKDHASWARFSDEFLDWFVHHYIWVYGSSPREDLIPDLIPLYRMFVERIPVGTRYRNLQSMCGFLSRREVSANAMLPYICEDPDGSVVATATISGASAWPIQDGDPLTGPKGLLDRLRDDGVAHPGAVFMGLLALGDRRVMKLLWDERQLLAVDVIATAGATAPPILFLPVIEFWLDLLAEVVNGPQPPGLVKLVATPLLKMALQGEGDVLEIERQFGVPDSEDAVRLLDGWTLPAVAERVRRRLEALVDLEHEPQLIPKLIRAWDLEPSG